MSRNRTQKSAINASVSLGAHLFSIVLSFVARTVFVACMQTEYLGISGLFLLRNWDWEMPCSLPCTAL